MRREQSCGNQNPTGFFLIALSHETLLNHYKSNFELMQTHKYSMRDLDNMIPFEREIYIHMLNEMINKKNEAMKRNG